MLFATVTPSLVICERSRKSCERVHKLVSIDRAHLGAAKGLLDDHVAALGSEGDGDGLCEDIDAGEERLATLVAEAELLRVEAAVRRNAAG